MIKSIFVRNGSALVIGLILCAAGFSKLLNFSTFNGSLSNIFPVWLSKAHLGILIPSIEIVVGLNLLRFDFTIALKSLLALLIVSFLGVTFDLAFVNTTHACSCFFGQFANLFGTSPTRAFVRAIILCALSIPIFLEGERSSKEKLENSMHISSASRCEPQA